MKRLVSLRPRAEADLLEARVWYDEQRPGLGEEFVASVGEAIGSLEKEAERFPLYYRGFRRLLLRRFPYKLFYRIEGDRVIVFRVLHAKRDHHRHLAD